MKAFATTRFLCLAGWVGLAAGFVAPLSDGRMARRRISFLLSVTKSPSLPTSKTDGTASSISQEQDASSSAFQLIADLSGACLLQSDIRRDALAMDPESQGAFKQAASATNWIHEPSAFTLQQALNQVQLEYFTTSMNDGDNSDSSATSRRDHIARRETAAQWIRWMKTVPSPAIVDFSTELHSLLQTNTTVLDLLDQTLEDFQSRLFCRVLLFPSGLALAGSLVEPPSSIIYGKLLYGGITRYRLLESSSDSRQPARRAGERTALQATPQDATPCWLMYGGAKRMYQALDVGPAAILEIGLLPRRRELLVPVSSGASSYTSTPPGTVMIRNLPWSPHDMLGFVSDEAKDTDSQDATIHDTDMALASPTSLAGSRRNQAFQADFTSQVGGLSAQIDAIVRRVLDGRVIRPADGNTGRALSNSAEWDATTRELAMASLEAAELSLLGLEPVRGLLLYGPPGCGKTALAREISRALRARAPKIVAAPELLDRWVGGSEKAVRALFADAEAELAACGGDATRSALHVVVIDEIDAVFWKRTSAEDTGEATRSSVVNQILSKLDGINAIPNVLLIGMTNRRELLDDALLRPGRLEVQIEIPLPDANGRREILQIHFAPLRKNGRLSQPLCRAIDGRATEQFYPETMSRLRKRDYIKNKMANIIPSLNGGCFDLASDAVTGGFSGADIAGLVRCAGSIALARARRDGSGVQGLLITVEDVKEALAEIQT